MTKMKKSGKWNFLQSLTGAFRKKRQPSDEVTGNPELPFASHHDIPTANQPTAEIEVKKYEAIPEARHKAAAETKKIESAAHSFTGTELRPPALDLDMVQRETGLTNNAFAHHKAKIQPKRRAPGKYTEKLNQRSTSLDRLSEDSAAFIAENSESSDRPSLPIGNERDKGSLTPDSGGGLTDGSVNDLFELSSDCDLMETTSKAARVARKHSNEYIEGKEDVVFLHLPGKKNRGTELPRTCETGRTSSGTVDGTVGTDPVVKTAGARNQHGSTESLPGERAKASGDVSLEEDSSNLKVSEVLEPASGMSRSAKGSRKLPRTYVVAGDNEQESLMLDSSVLGSNIWETSGVEISASGSSLDSVGAGSRENLRKSLKALKTGSKVTADRIRAKSMDDGRGVGDTVKENVKVRLNSYEMDVESEVKASDKKDRDEKRKRKVGFADETIAEIGVVEIDNRLVESAKDDKDIWAEVDQNENLATSLKDHSSDASLVYHDGKNLGEINEQTGLKHDVKALAAATAISPRSSRKDRGVKTDKHHEISDLNEMGTKGHAPVSEVVESADSNKPFPKVRKVAFGDVAQESDKIKGGSTSSNEPSALAEKVTPGDGNAKSVTARSIRRKAVGGDSVDISGADGEKICGIEPSDRKTHPLDDSHDASSGSSEVKAVLKYPGNKTKSDNVKTASRSSTENIAAAAVDAGKAGSNEEPMNELDKAFQKVRTKPPVPGVPSNQSGHPQSTKPSLETQLPHSDGLKAAKNIPIPPAKSQVDALGRSLGGSQRRTGDPKSAGNNSTITDSKKPMMVTAEADKSPVDGDGSSLLNKAKLPPAPVPAKRPGKVQPKPAENEKELAWVNRARRLSKDFSDRVLSAGTESEGQKVDNEVETDDNFERGGMRTSVKDMVRKLQQKSQNG